MLSSFRFCMRAVKIPLLICLCFYQSSSQQSRTSYAPSSIPRPSMSAVVSIFRCSKNFSLILLTFLFVFKVRPVAHGSQNLAVGTTPSSKQTNKSFKQVCNVILLTEMSAATRMLSASTPQLAGGATPQKQK